MDVSVDQIMEQARKAVDEGDVPLARQLLDYVVRVDPSNPDAARLLARLADGERTVNRGPSLEPTYDYARQLAYQAAVVESARLGIPPPGPIGDRARRWGVARIWLTVVLVALIPIGFRAAWGDYSATFHQQDVDDAQFNRSPWCAANAIDVDAALPPCTLVPAIIVSKTTRTRPSEAYGQYTDYNLRVREATGAEHDYAAVSERFWEQLTVGEAVSVKQWRGQEVELDAGAESIGLTMFRGDAGAIFHRVAVWFFVAVGSIAVLQMIWWRPRRRRWMPWL